ncbi:MAG: transposase, partial [Methanosarcinaceae archaeon]
MLKPVERSEIPEDTAELGEKLLKDDDIYRKIGEELSDLIKDEDFADMYSPIGGPALSPALLSLVLIFQMLEKIPDRLAANAVRLRIDWKYALHLPLDWEGFYFTNLSNFRQRLLEHGAEYRVFDILLKKLVELGYIRKRGKQRTDSMSVLGVVANLSRLELVWETLRVVLKAIEKSNPVWLETAFPEAFLQLYLVKRTDYNLTKLEIAKELSLAGADGLWLLEQLEKAPATLQNLPEIETMQEIWEQQFGWDENAYIGPREKL